MSHTKEPWYVVGYSEEAVIEMPEGEEIIFPYENDKEKWLGVARRIVACVNALQGLNPEAVGDVVEALREAHRFMDYWCKHVGHGEWGEVVHGRSQRKRIETALAKLED